MNMRSAGSPKNSAKASPYDKDFHKQLLTGGVVNFSLGTSKRTRNKQLGMRTTGQFATSGPYVSGESSSTGTGFFGRK